MSFEPSYVYTPFTRPSDGYGGMSYAFFNGDYLTFFNPNGGTGTMVTRISSMSQTESLDWVSTKMYNGTMFSGAPRSHKDEFYGTYDEIIGRHRKVYCSISTDIPYRQQLLIPFSTSGNTIEIGTEQYGEALADKIFLTGSTTYSGYPVVCPCVGINNSCEAVITVKDEVGNYTIAKNTTTYAIPRRYYSGELKANNSIRLYNTSTAERIITITRSGTVVGTVNVAAGATGYISLGDYNPNDKLVLTSEEAKTKAAHIYVGGEWKDAQAKVYVSGAWKDCTAYVWRDEAWHVCS